MNATSQLRKHLRFSWINKIRLILNRRKLAFCGENVFFDKNIELMRFPRNISINHNAVIKEGAKICPCNANARITIGENTTIGYHTFIFASEKIDIGNNCLIAPFVYIVDSDHSIEMGTLINQQPNKTAKVVIEDDVWISTGAKILKGVTIHTGAVIAAGSVVTSDVEAYSIVGGIPAKKISDRK